MHTDCFVQVKGSGPPVSVAELEANLYDSTANPNDSDGNILEDPCRKLHSIKAPLLKTLTERTMDDLQNHNILGKRDKVEMKAIESLPYDEDGDLATEPHRAGSALRR